MLDLEEFINIIGDIIERYLEVDTYLKNQMKDMSILLRMSHESRDIVVDIVRELLKARVTFRHIKNEERFKNNDSIILVAI